MLSRLISRWELNSNPISLLCYARYAHSDNDAVQNANQELDDFFGVQHAPPSSSPPSTGHASLSQTEAEHPASQFQRLAADSHPYNPSQVRLPERFHDQDIINQFIDPATHHTHPTSPSTTQPAGGLRVSASRQLHQPSDRDQVWGLDDTGTPPTQSLHQTHSHAGPHAGSASYGYPQPSSSSSRADVHGRDAQGGLHGTDGHSNSGSEGDSRCLTHVDGSGRATMVDVGQKPPTTRVAEASARVLLGEAAFRLVKDNKMQKGDVLTVAQLGGIMAAKATSTLIPLCHPLPLTKVDVQLSLQEQGHQVLVRSLAKTTGTTGVEMEALTAAAVAALTVYDMCKAVSKGIVITDVRLESKSGGKSGDYKR